MASAKFSFYQENLENWLRVVPRRASDESVSLPYQQFPPDLPSSINIEFDNLEPDVYKFYFYNSPDGSAQGTLIHIFTYDVRQQLLTSEVRFYTVGGANSYDPVNDSDEIIDPYLEGKTKKLVYKEGFRPLEPVTEWQDIAGGGIKLLGYSFASGEKMAVELDFLVNQVTNETVGFFDGVATIVNNTTLDSSYLNKRCKIEAVSSRIIITLDILGNVPSNKFLYFTTHAGSQIQAKFVTQNSESVFFMGQALEEITLGYGEALWLIKSGTSYDVVNDVRGMQEVGDDLDLRNIRPNTLPLDGRLIDGDDYPRLYWWVNTKLPAFARLALPDATVISGSFVHPVGQEGLYVTSLTTKQMRLPNLRNRFKRALKSFTVFNSDSERGYDYPGGGQEDMNKAHTHTFNPLDKQGQSDNANDRNVMLPDTTGRNLTTGSSGGIESRPKNIGIIMAVKV